MTKEIVSLIAGEADKTTTKKHTSKKINKVNESKNILPGVMCNTTSVRWNKQRTQCLVQLRLRNWWIDSFCQAIWWIDDSHQRWAHKIPEFSFSSSVLTQVGYYSHRESTFILSAGASCVASRRDVKTVTLNLFSPRQVNLDLCATSWVTAQGSAFKLCILKKQIKCLAMFL